MKQNIKIIFVNVEEVDHIVKLGLPPYKDWVARVTGLRPEQIVTINAADGDAFPDNLDSIDGIIGGGSGHQPYEQASWIKNTGELFKRAHKQGVPQLLNCFCHQVFTTAMGGQAALGEHERRFGIETLHLTEAGRKDPLFDGLPPTFELFTSHSAVVSRLPSGTKPIELANTDYYPYESLAFDGNTRTVQSHPELHGAVLEALAHARTKTFGKDVPLQAYQKYLDSPPSQTTIARVEANGKKLFHNWLTHYVLPYQATNARLLTAKT
jgi:GMP synthase (glutamine-hydrolysing)